MTKEQFVDDVILQVLQSDPSDDTEIEKDQIAYWGSQYLQFLQNQEIAAELRAGRFIPPIYLVRESCRPISLEASECGTGCQDRFKIELNGEVLDVENDSGIAQITTDEGDFVYKASMASLNMFRNLRFSKPSNSNLLYYRQGKTIYVEGIKESEREFNELTIDYVPKQDLLSMNPTDDVKITSLLWPQLVDLTVQRLKLQMYGSVPDTANDGEDVKKPQYHTAIKNGVDEQQDQ